MLVSEPITVIRLAQPDSCLMPIKMGVEMRLSQFSQRPSSVIHDFSLFVLNHRREEGELLLG